MRSVTLVGNSLLPTILSTAGACSPHGRDSGGEQRAAPAMWHRLELADVLGHLLRRTGEALPAAVRGGRRFPDVQPWRVVGKAHVSRVAARLRGVLLHSRERLFHLRQRAHGVGGVVADGVPLVGETAGASQGRGALAAHPDGRMGLLHRLGLEVEVGEAAELAVKGGRLAGPQLLEGANVLGGDGAAAVEVGRLDGLELLPQPARAAAHDEAAAGQDVDGREHLCRQHRRSVRDHHDGGEQPQRRGARGQEGMHRQHLHDLRVEADGAVRGVRVWRAGVARHDDVVAHRHDAEAQSLAVLDQPGQGFRRRLFAPGGCAKADVQGRPPRVPHS